MATTRRASPELGQDVGTAVATTQFDAAVLAAIGKAVVVVELDGRVARWNPAAEALYGWSADQAIGRQVVELTGVSTWDTMSPEQRRRLRDGQAVTDEFVVNRADGTHIPVEIVNRGVPDRDGRLIAVVGVATDISELQRVRRRAQRRAHQQAVVAALGRSALQDLDLDRLFDDAVKTLADELDAPLAKVLELDRERQVLWLRAGVGWRDGLVGVAHVPADRGSQAGYTLHRDMPIVVTDLERDTRFSGPGLLIEHGVVSGISTLIRAGEVPYGVLGVHTTDLQDFSEDDVTFVDAVAGVLASAVLRRQLEDELLTTIQRLERSDEIRAGFLRATSHELRTPLTVVTGLAATLRRAWHELDEESLRGLLDRMVVNGEHLQRLIEELLDIDRLNAGLVSAVAEPRDLRELVEIVLRQADIGGRALTTRLEPVVAPVDAAKIERVVDNLLTNAVRHTPADASICVEVTTRDDDAVIAVSDDGPGVNLDEPAEIFEPFVQGRERAADPTPGTGLGLTIVRQLTELHGGEATVDSLPEGGTRFEVRLPRSAGGAQLPPSRN